MTIPFIQARNYTRGRQAAIDLIVIHTMETPEGVETAEQIARWFAGSTAPQASTHYNIDSDSIVQSVRDSDVAWCAPGANHDGLHFEHAGRARQTPAEWADPYSKKMLARSAELVAEKCRMYHIPVVWLSVSDVQAGKRGITSHNNVSLAFRRSNHWDPGPHFPVTSYLALVTKALKGTHDTHGAKVFPILRPKDRGFHVKRAQRLLRKHGYVFVVVNGVYGTLTYWAVRRFQKKHGLKVDGVIGEKTWKALRAVPSK